MTTPATLEEATAALFSLLQGSITAEISGDVHAGKGLVDNLSSTTDLFVGLPVFGRGIVRGALIQSLDPVAKTLTLTKPPTLTANVALTTGYLTLGRRLQWFTDIGEFPALFLRSLGAEDEYHQTILRRTTLDLEAWIYTQGALDPDVAPSQVLNYLVQAVRDALGPDDRDRHQLTLGGRVFSCRIEGRTDFDPGDRDGTAKAVIPIKIVMP